MTIKRLLISGLIVISLAGCSNTAGPTLGNISIPGNAKNAATTTIGKNKQLTYMTDGNMGNACDAQTKLAVAANYEATGKPLTEDLYTRISLKNDKLNIVLVCAEQKEGETLIGTKVTMTLIES